MLSLRAPIVGATVLLVWLFAIHADAATNTARWGVDDTDFASLDPEALTRKARVGTRAAELQQAAASGDADAAVLLGVAQLYGLGVPKDERSAARLIHRAADAGHARGMAGWGAILIDGLASEKADPVAGRRWVQRSAEQGNLIAMNNLAWALERGLGGPVDAFASAQWATRAAERGFAPSMFLLAMQLYEGHPASGSSRGIAKNRVAAADWLRRAAQRGMPSAMNNLGIMLFDGDGIPKDMAEGEKWLRAAIAAGDTKAKANLDSRLARRDANATAAASPSTTSTANELPPERHYYTAEYCAAVSNILKDGPLARRWLAVAATWFAAAPEPKRSRARDDADLDASMDARKAFDGTSEAVYEGCKSKVGAAETAARAEAARQADAKEADVRRHLNPYAPRRLVIFDRVGIIRGWDPAKRTRNDILAWDAYCFVAGETLVAMTNRNPAAFAIDPSRHQSLLQAIRERRDFLKSRFVQDFKPEEHASMQTLLDQQRTNYGKGFEARRGSERDVVDFVKTQVFQCDDEFKEFEHRWDDASR